MLKKFFTDTKKYYIYTMSATKAQLKSEVANSYLNWIWWILEPLCFTMVYYLVFGIFFHMKEDYIIPFIVLGVATWDYFSRMTKTSVKIMRRNKSIVSKVYLPKHVLIFVQIGVNAFKMLVTFLIAVVAMIILQVPISFNVFFVIPVLIQLFLFTFGLSCFLLHFGVFVADLNNIVNIVLKMVFYLTGVFYDVTKRISGLTGELMEKLNPVAFVISSLRKSLLYQKAPDIWVLLGWLAFSIILCIFGVILIYKNENSYVKSI